MWSHFGARLLSFAAKSTEGAEVAVIDTESTQTSQWLEGYMHGVFEKWADWTWGILEQNIAVLSNW